MYECRNPLSIYEVYLSSKHEVYVNFASQSISLELALRAGRSVIILYNEFHVMNIGIQSNTYRCEGKLVKKFNQTKKGNKKHVFL